MPAHCSVIFPYSSLWLLFLYQHGITSVSISLSLSLSLSLVSLESMATEALVTDQTAQGHVEEVKLTDEVAKIVEKDTSPESKDLKEKDDEKTKVDDSTSVEATANKVEDAVMPEETQEDKVETEMKEVEKEESENAKDGTSKQDADSLISDSKEEAAVEPATEAAVEGLKDQVEVANISEPPKLTVEEAADVSGEKLVQERVSETAKEPEASEVAAEEVNTAPEAAAEEVNTSAEAAAEEVNTTPEIVAETVNPTQEKAGEEVSKTEEAEPAKEELQVTDLLSETVKKSLGDFFSVKLEENIESPKEELPVADLSKPEEVSHPEAVASKIEDAVVSGAPVKDLKEEAERADATEVDQNASGNAEKIVSIDTDPVAESTETVVKPEDKVEQEMQERTVEAEEPIASDTVKADAATEVSLEASAIVEGPPLSSEGEKASESVEDRKNESVEGEKPASVETSRDINAEGEKTEKDAAEAPKEEVAIKSSQRQSNNIFSKVKQSMVKVKKAIIGKSPSSKTISAEGKDEIKVK
ncbi:uncharacterized protein A4U43_C07F11870 [Asparagus officinalis]|uniref:Uncharacterized protein n=1 Tax=Asparagus officinalis TaxID=4686 RepID=A0A5P1EB81_ASPOF|nr:uncharacterized protein A4U43_C07F11870 [Asparagus officinalis]